METWYRTTRPKDRTEVNCPVPGCSDLIRNDVRFLSAQLDLSVPESGLSDSSLPLTTANNRNENTISSIHSVLTLETRIAEETARLEADWIHIAQEQYSIAYSRVRILQLQRRLKERAANIFAQSNQLRIQVEPPWMRLWVLAEDSAGTVSPHGDIEESGEDVGLRTGRVVNISGTRHSLSSPAGGGDALARWFESLL